MKYGIALVALLAVVGPVLFERHNSAGLDAVETVAGEWNRVVSDFVKIERQTRLQRWSDILGRIAANREEWEELAHFAANGWIEERGKRVDGLLDHISYARDTSTGANAAEFKARLTALVAPLHAMRP